MLPLTTVLLLLLAILIFQRSPNIEVASQIGGFISAIAASLAFIWLIAGFFQQSKELGLQRKELSMQRHALLLQQEELKKISEFNALQQISSMLDLFNSSLPAKQIPNINTVEDLIMAFMNNMSPAWNIILKSTNDEEIFASYTEWFKIESICRQFISVFYSAVTLYAEATGEITIVKEGNKVEYLYHSHAKINNIPHLQQYSGAAYGVASNFFHFEPGLKRIELAGFEATNRLNPGVVKQDALEKLRQEVKNLDDKKQAAETQEEPQG